MDSASDVLVQMAMKSAAFSYFGSVRSDLD